MPMLDIKNLTLEMQSSDGAIKALDKVNLSVSSGEIRAQNFLCGAQTVE